MELLRVRHAKLGHHRLPPHATTITALLAYRQLRDQRFARPRSEALLVSSAGTRLLYCNVGLTFARLARQAGLAARSGSCRPRQHDLRHSFAVGGSEDGVDRRFIQVQVGHECDSSTAIYTHVSDDFMNTALRKALAPPFAEHGQCRKGQ
jgi:integrase